jgi:hypothetical protein
VGIPLFLDNSGTAGRGEGPFKREERAFSKDLIGGTQDELTVICELDRNIWKAISF